MHDSFAVFAFDVAAVVPHHLHGSVAACDQLSVAIERKGKVVNVHIVLHTPGVIQPKDPLLGYGNSRPDPYPLVLGRKGLTDDVLVPLVVYCLSHLLLKATALVQDGPPSVQILTGVHTCVTCLVARPSDLQSAITVLLRQSLPCHPPIPSLIFWAFSLKLINGVAGRDRCGEQENTPEVLVRLFPFVSSDSIKSGDVGVAQKRLWVGLASREKDDVLAAERRTNAQVNVWFQEPYPGSCPQTPDSS